MKYGLLIRRNSYFETCKQALLAEKYGFDSVHVDDHFYDGDHFYEGELQSYLEAMTVIVAIAVKTAKVKLGHAVLCNSYRNPALLAKMISSLDHISQGRALLWIGAGWREEEYKAYGYPFPSAKERVDQVEEAITIFKKLFTEQITNLNGKFWKLENCRNFPKPVQKPHPQIVIGATKNRLLTIACREANGINMNYKGDEFFRERIDFINMKLQKFGRDPSKFEISSQNMVTLVRNKNEKERIVNEALKQVKDEKATKQKILKENFIGTPWNSFVGTPDEMKEKIQALEQIGVKKMVTAISGSPSIEDPLKLFYEEIIR